ncbi:sigma factor [Paracoccaceae bacterium Fryx2]|nr:sigma factor [Paracoccaceae bacterium Fryx2]
MMDFASMKPDPRDDIAEHVPTLRAYALCLTRNRAAADDLVQDAIIHAWTRIDTFCPGTNMRVWLVAILRSLHYADLRLRDGACPDPEWPQSSGPGGTPGDATPQPGREFMDAYHRLLPLQREALALVGSLGFSCEEAAAVARIAAGTMRNRVNRAQRLLCKRLGPEYGRDTGFPEGAKEIGPVRARAADVLGWEMENTFRVA